MTSVLLVIKEFSEIAWISYDLDALSVSELHEEPVAFDLPIQTKAAGSA